MEIKNTKTYKKIHTFLDRIQIPVLGISLWRLLEIYIGGIFEKQLLRLASSISWTFFFSLFPFILFILSVLPYLPHYNELYKYIFYEIMPRVLPDHMLLDIVGYIKREIIPKIEDISNFTILLVLIFATNGTYALISGFNHDEDTKRGWFFEYSLALAITVGFITSIIGSLLGIYYGEVVMKLFMSEYEYEKNWFLSHLTTIISYFSFPLVYGLGLALFYWAGTKKITKFRNALPGAIFTTVLFMIVTYFFAFYMREIASYNVLYGAVGSIILLMIWVDVNVVLVLLGNELNLVIRRLHAVNEWKKKTGEMEY